MTALLVLSGFTAYVMAGIFFALMFLASIVARNYPITRDELLGAMCMFVIAWPMVLALWWDDNRDGPWKG